MQLICDSCGQSLASLGQASALLRTGALEAEEAVCGAVSSTAPVLTRAVWQCGGGYQELTDRVVLMHFDLTQPLRDVQGQATAR